MLTKLNIRSIRAEAGLWLGLFLGPALLLLSLPAGRLQASARTAQFSSGIRPSASAPFHAATPTKSLAVIFSTEQNGYLTPCGCSQPQKGGMLRLAAWTRKLAQANVLVQVENGDLTNAMGRQDSLKAETLIDMFNALKYDAINLGEKDFRLGVPALQALQMRFHGAMLCGNVLQENTKPPFPSSVLLKRQVDGRNIRLLVVGLLSQQFGDEIAASNPGLRLESPTEALKRLQESLQEPVDARILLFHGPAAEAETLVRQFPLFQLVVCAHQGDEPMPTIHTGPAVLVCNGQDGKFAAVAWLDPRAGCKVSRVDYTPLGPEFSDDPALAVIKRAYIQRVDMEGLLAQVLKMPTDSGDTYAGSQSCANCHAAAFRIWQQSGHSHALHTLATVQEDRDPECVLCHVVGLNRQGGFVSAQQSPALANVGCESCHGPAARHVHNPKTSLPNVGTDTCEACHTPEQSPHFTFDAYWPRIRH